MKIAVATALLLVAASCAKDKAPRNEPTSGPASRIGDPSIVTKTMTPSTEDDSSHNRSGEPTVTGIGIRPVLQKGGFVIGQVFPGGPADLAGLRNGDLVVKVDGTPTARWSMEKVVGEMRGISGTQVTLEVVRGFDPPRTFVVTRREVIVIPPPAH